MMTKPPERIYLQCYDDQGEYLDPATGDVTWCVDQINEIDAEYILVKQPRCEYCNCKLDKNDTCPECAAV